jgi:predicted nucleic acid-binding protein
MLLPVYSMTEPVRMPYRWLIVTLGLTDVILCEVLRGVRDDIAAKDVERQLLKLEVFDRCGADLARDAAGNYRTLRARGHTVRKTIDCLIATFGIREQHSLLHRLALESALH